MTSFDSRPDTYAHIAEVQALLLGVVKELLDRAHGHDASKLVDPERAMFDEFTSKLRDTTFGSDEYKGYLRDMGSALAHHYAENRHHPEHHPDGIDGMTLVDLVEMICDWTAATKRHADGDIRRSIEINQDRFGYGDQLKRVFHNTVSAFAVGSDSGVSGTCRHESGPSGTAGPTTDAARSAQHAPSETSVAASAAPASP